jgi:hypothetical protein
VVTVRQTFQNKFRLDRAYPKAEGKKKKKLKSGNAQEALERSFRASFEEPARANL